ncbi:hypothetical protein FRC01_002479 [Tulasnella sp. 417]|nr:hypothetical protein FRC01_002479 [Tulasnella sp. 417]
MKPISAATINNILTLIDNGHSNRAIAAQMNVSSGKVSDIRTKYRPNMERSKGGRPPILSEAEKRLAGRTLMAGKAQTAVQLKKIIATATGKDPSPQTIRRGLKDEGFESLHKVKKPLLTEKHRRARLHWAEAHRKWTTDDWKPIIWSDETKFNRFGSDGLQWAWKKKGEKLNDRLVKPTLKFGGGSMMMWGCMTWEGVGNACKIDGIMDAELYVAILDDDLLETLKDYDKDPSDIIFQQDNDPKHTSKRAKKWFKDNEIEVLPWPAQSPDLNPIEHLWVHVKRKLAEYETAPKGVNELWSRVQDVWGAIPASVCQGLIESMPRRVEAVFQAKGGYTEY